MCVQSLLIFLLLMISLHYGQYRVPCYINPDLFFPNKRINSNSVFSYKSLPLKIPLSCITFWKLYLRLENLQYQCHQNIMDILIINLIIPSGLFIPLANLAKICCKKHLQMLLNVSALEYLF